MFELGSFTLESLMGIVIVAFLGHALAVRREKGKARHAAGIELKQAILRSEDEIKSGKNPREVIAVTFEKHNDLAINYAAHLSSESLQIFDAAFNRYRTWYSVMCNRSATEVLY